MTTAYSQYHILCEAQRSKAVQRQGKNLWRPHKGAPHEEQAWQGLLEQAVTRKTTYSNRKFDIIDPIKCLI